MRSSLIALLCTVALPAFALSTPEPSQKDAHVRTQAYDPQNRTLLVLQQGMVTNITFDTMEMIKRIVFGDEDGPVTSLKKDDGNQNPLINNLPLFGKVVGRTDMVVITHSADGMERPYLFAIQVVPAPRDGSEAAEATFSLSFTYPIQQKQAAQQVAAVSWKEKQAAKMQAVAESRLNTDVFYGQQNWAYMAMSNFRTIAPIEAHDNGRLTVLRYPGNMDHPAIFKVLDGAQAPSAVCNHGKPTKDELNAPEQMVSTVVMDDMIVVQQTAPHFRLRAGDQVADVWNCKWDPIGAEPSPEVYRKVVTSK